MKAINCTPSVKNPFFYNISKIEQGKAELVAVRNIRSSEFGVLYRTLLEREARAIRTEKPSVHLALSGDDGEMLTDEEAVELIDRCLTPLDMADQPYFIVRHDDTDHVHYHVVSTKVKEDGRSILWNGIGKRLILELMKYQEEYGYIAGKDLHEAKLQEGDVKKMGTKADIRREFDAALSGTSFRSREEFIEGVKSRNVRMTIFMSKHTGKEMIRCNRLDADGKAISRPVYLKEDEVLRLDKAVEWNKKPADQKTSLAPYGIDAGKRLKNAVNKKKAFVQGFFPGTDIDWPGIQMTLEKLDILDFYVENKRFAMTTIGGKDVISFDPIPFDLIPKLSDIIWRDQAGELLAYRGQVLVPLKSLIPDDGLFIPASGYQNSMLPPGFRIEEYDGFGFLVNPNGKSNCIQDGGGLYIRLRNGEYDVITQRQHNNLERLKKISGQTSKRSLAKTTKSRH